MMTEVNKELFEDRFKVDKIDPDNKTPFRNVSRVHLQSYSVGNNRRAIELDINIQIYPVSFTDTFLLRVVSCGQVKNLYSQEELNKPSDRDSYEYVMYGMVFDLEEKGNELVVYISFGGLLMRIAGPLDAMANFRKEGKEARVFLMMKRA
jgi:DNA-directed RNA polymerases I, II, and III subunit RPABC3